MKFYEISDRLEYILANCVDDDGAMTQETADMLDDLEDVREDKLIELALYMKGEAAEAEAVRIEMATLASRMMVHKNRADWIYDYMNKWFEAGEKIKDPRVVLSTRKSTAVVVTNEELVPLGYWRTKVEKTIDKKAAAKVLKGEIKIPGLALEVRNNLVIK